MFKRKFFEAIDQGNARCLTSLQIISLSQILFERGGQRHCCTELEIPINARSFALAPVAQLDRASDFGSEGWGFDSLRAYSPELRGNVVFLGVFGFSGESLIADENVE